MTAGPQEKATRFRDVEAARAAFGPTLVDGLVAGCFVGDPVADAVVQAFRALPGGTGWRMLERGLAGSVDPDTPPALRVLLEEVTTVPEWVDRDRLHAGAVAYWRAGSGPLSLALFCGSLAFGYQSASLSRPLAATGRLQQMASRRLGETARWALAVTTPGGMEPGSLGHASSVRVRMVHALVRAHLLDGDDWDTANWGVPLSAADAAATAMGGFLTIPLQAMRDLGVRHRRQELEDMAHLWAWIGVVMGVPAALAPPEYTAAREQVRAALAIDAGPDEDSARLMHALLHDGVPLDRLLPGLAARPAGAVGTQLLAGLTRRWMGDEMADRLGVARTPLTHAALLARPVALARQAVLSTGVLGGPERIGDLERALVKRVLAQGRAARAPLAPQDAARAPVLRAVA